MIVSQFFGSMLLLAASAADADQLAEIRAKLDGYLSRIESVQLRYVERWQPGENFDEGWKRDLESPLPEDVSPEMLRGMVEGRKKMKERGVPETVSTHDLLDAYPSFRRLIDTESTYADGGIERSHRELYARNGRLTSINRKSKQASTSALGTATLLQRNPLNAIGYRLPTTLNMRVTELLQFPQLTTIGGREDVGGFSAIYVKIGPDLPQAVRNNLAANEQMFYELWLDPDHEFVPVRIDAYYENQFEGKRGFTEGRGVVLQRVTGDDGRKREFLRYRMEVREFMQAPDLGRKEQLRFPKRASFDDGAGTYLWEVVGAEINPPIAASDFEPSIPDDYLISNDGEIRIRTIQGGSKGRQQRFDESAKKARDALAASVPHKPLNESSRLSWRFAAPMLLGITIVLLVVFKLRSG